MGVCPKARLNMRWKWKGESAATRAAAATFNGDRNRRTGNPGRDGDGGKAPCACRAAGRESVGFAAYLHAQTSQRPRHHAGFRIQALAEIERRRGPLGIVQMTLGASPR